MTAPTSHATTLVVATLTLALAAGACGGLGTGPDSPGTPGGTDDERTAVDVIEVVDGDTIRVDLDGSSTPVRLIGIDTPEREGPYTHEECFGEEASRYTAGALGGRAIELEFDVERTDRFDRTLAYAWLDGELFNERILLDGFALQATFPPNLRYVDRFTEAQRIARASGAGLWHACPAP
ncbi:MAG: thermonuclease family protein [Actinomycetota bacterium]